VDEDAFATQVNDFASYVARKISNKDEVRLLLEPAEILTPLFLADLRKMAECHPLALFFDTYERTGDYLDVWLRDLLEGRYGDAPVNILLVIAGRDALDRNLWSPYEGLLARLCLEPFTEEESRDFLARRKITDEQVVEVILRLSGHLPLLVATLAAESPGDPNIVGDPSGDAVERFLKWVSDPKQRQVALDAALPRRLNRDVLAVIVGDKEADALFDWLRRMPFVERQGNGWTYHKVVRAQMLLYKQQLSPKGWADIHRRLAEYYEKVCDNLGLKETGPQNEAWQGYALEALFHHLCQAPQVHLTEALNGFLAAWDAQYAFARRWIRTIYHVGEDAGDLSLQRWGQRLEEGMEAYDNDRHQQAVEMFTALLEHARIGELWQAVALDERGWLFYWIGRYEDALTDLNRALELAPQRTSTLIHRGITHRQIGCYEEALADFNCVSESDPNLGWAIANRSVTYRLMKRYEEALADSNRAIELRPDLIWPIASRGMVYRRMERYEEALADFNQAIELDAGLTWAIAHRGMTYRDTGRYEKALTDFNQAIELEPDSVWLIAERGWTYFWIGRYDEALTNLNQAIERQPGLAWAIVHRGIVYREIEFYAEAIADFEATLESDLVQGWVLANRGSTYSYLGRYEDALADLNQALELDFNQGWAVARRGAIHRAMGCYEKALADYDRAIELEPQGGRFFQGSRYFYGRALTYQALSQTEQAQADFIMALRHAKQIKERTPLNWSNILDLMLCCLATGETKEAELVFEEAFYGETSPHRIRKAIRGLEGFLAYFPDHPEASVMCGLLQRHLKKVEEQKQDERQREHDIETSI
jgi:tetratricopeptide (TPR) repeat protein